MRNHSHCSRNKLARDGREFNPSPGQNPRGAKNNEINPASSSIPSDWYPEKSCAALTNEMKQAKQTTSIPRGQTFATTSKDASMPIQHKLTSMCVPAEIHKSVGANQSPRATPSEWCTACKYSFAGSRPCGPINPRI